MTRENRKSVAAALTRKCPMSACMALLGGMWTPNVIWQLSHGARRFGELAKEIPGISPKMLSVRLRELETKRVVVRTVIPDSPPSVRYALSPLGQELTPVIESIVKVGWRLLGTRGRQARRAH